MEMKVTGVRDGVVDVALIGRLDTPGVAGIELSWGRPRDHDPRKLYICLDSERDFGTKRRWQRFGLELGVSARG